MLGQWLQRRNSSEDPEEFRLSLVEHLDELRVRIIRALIAIAICWVVGWVVHDPLYNMLAAHMRELLPKDLRYQEVFHSITDAFFLKLKLSFTFGLILALPVVVMQIWGFIKPGLKPTERKPFQVIGPLSIGLFFLGCYFCWLILPPTMSWFGDFVRTSYEGVNINQEAGTLVFFALNMMLGFGLGFQLPLIVYFLAMIGLLPPELLSKYWRQAMVIIFAASAIITPSADPFSMMMMAVPLTALFFLSVMAVRITKKKKRISAESALILED